MAPRPRMTLASGLVAAAVMAVLFGSFWRQVMPADFHQFWFVAEVDPRSGDGFRANGPALSPYPPANRQAFAETLERHFRGPAGDPVQRRALELTDEVFPQIGDGLLIQSTGTPLLYATADLISTRSFGRSARVAFAIQSLTLIGVILLIGWEVGFGPGAAVVWAGGIVALFQSFASDLIFGNVAAIQTGMLVGSAWLASRNHWATAGGLAAFCALLKPTAAYPVVAMSLLLLAALPPRTFVRFVAGGLLGGAVALLLTLRTFGTYAVWPQWFQLVLPNLRELCYPRTDGNIGLVAAIHHYTGRDAGSVLSAMVVIPVFALALARGRKTGSGGLSFSFLVVTQAAGTSAMLLSSPLVWMHYLVLTFPALVVFCHESAAGVRVIAAITLACTMDHNLLRELSLGDATSEVILVQHMLFPLLVTGLCVHRIATPAATGSVIHRGHGPTTVPNRFPIATRSFPAS